MDEFCQILTAEMGNVLGNEIGKFGGFGNQSRRVHHNAGMRYASQFLQFIGIVPDDVEIANHTLNEFPGRTTPCSLLQR